MTDVNSTTFAVRNPKAESGWRGGEPGGRFAHPSNTEDAQLTRELGAVAADFLRECGFGDVVVTPAGSNGGIDVMSTKSVAHVKVVGSAIVRGDVERLAGFAAPGSKRAVCFSLTGYSSAALNAAEALGVALFRFTDESELAPMNDGATRLLHAAAEVEEVETDVDAEGSTREARRARRAARRAELDGVSEADQRDQRSIELDHALINLQERARVSQKRSWRRVKVAR